MGGQDALRRADLRVVFVVALFLAVVFLAVVFLAVVFLAADFLAADFFAAVFFDRRLLGGGGVGLAGPQLGDVAGVAGLVALAGIEGGLQCSEEVDDLGVVSLTVLREDDLPVLLLGVDELLHSSV